MIERLYVTELAPADPLAIGMVLALFREKTDVIPEVRNEDDGRVFLYAITSATRYHAFKRDIKPSNMIKFDIFGKV